MVIQVYSPLMFPVDQRQNIYTFYAEGFRHRVAIDLLPGKRHRRRDLWL